MAEKIIKEAENYYGSGHVEDAFNDLLNIIKTLTGKKEDMDLDELIGNLGLTPKMQKLLKNKIKDFTLEIIKDISYGDDHLLTHNNGDFKDAKKEINKRLNK